MFDDIVCPWCKQDTDGFFRPVRPDGEWECAVCGEKPDKETLDIIWERAYDLSLPDMEGYAEQ